MHKQKEVKINVDEKLQPLIQFIYDNLYGIIPLASCEGGNQELNESSDCYILMVVRDINHLNKLMELCNVWKGEYNCPDPDTGNVPTYRISINNLDAVLDKLKFIIENNILY